MYRPVSFSLVDDLDVFLTAINAAEELYEFDRNEVDYILFEGEVFPEYVPNGIADAAELYLVEVAVKTRHLDLTYRSGHLPRPGVGGVGAEPGAGAAGPGLGLRQICGFS